MLIIVTKYVYLIYKYFCDNFMDVHWALLHSGFIQPPICPAGLLWPLGTVGGPSARIGPSLQARGRLAGLSSCIPWVVLCPTSGRPPYWRDTGHLVTPSHIRRKLLRRRGGAYKRSLPFRRARSLPGCNRWGLYTVVGWYFQSNWEDFWNFFISFFSFSFWFNFEVVSYTLTFIIYIILVWLGFCNMPICWSFRTLTWESFASSGSPLWLLWSSAVVRGSLWVVGRNFVVQYDPIYMCRCRLVIMRYEGMKIYVYTLYNVIFLNTN